jgi:hypothetical protein
MISLMFMAVGILAAGFFVAISVGLIAVAVLDILSNA